MTIEKLLECSADELAKMTDAELLEHFKMYLPITRPELAEKPKTSNIRSTHRSSNSSRDQSKFDFVANMAKGMGIDLSFDDD